MSQLADRKDQRKELLTQIGEKRGSKVISYITAERTLFGTQLSSSDTIPLFFEQLRSFGKVQKIDLFLYTRGGHTIAANRIVHLFREFCDKLSILIPFRAHSAGTIIALGADEIVMSPMGELGPVDPSVANAFNPLADEKDPKKGAIPISVEDVSAFLTLVKDTSGSSDVYSTALTALTDKVHPLSLGNVQRQYLLIRSLSKRLLEMHMKDENEKIEKIVEILSEKLYFHGYEISRHEAKEMIGLKVIYPDEGLEKLMWDLYTEYKDALLPGVEFDFNQHLTGRDSGDFTLDSATIESENILYAFNFSGTVRRKKPHGPEFDVNINKQGWLSP